MVLDLPRSSCPNGSCASGTCCPHLQQLWTLLHTATLLLQVILDPGYVIFFPRLHLDRPYVCRFDIVTIKGPYSLNLPQSHEALLKFQHLFHPLKNLLIFLVCFHLILLNIMFHAPIGRFQLELICFTFIFHRRPI